MLYVGHWFLLVHLDEVFPHGAVVGIQGRRPGELHCAGGEAHHQRLAWGTWNIWNSKNISFYHLSYLCTKSLFTRALNCVNISVWNKEGNWNMRLLNLSFQEYAFHWCKGQGLDWKCFWITKQMRGRRDFSFNYFQ